MATTRDRGPRAITFRTEMKSLWQPRNAACGICGQATIDWDGPRFAPESFELDHILALRDHPELEFDPGNAQPSHSKCNRTKGARGPVAALGFTSEEW